MPINSFLYPGAKFIPTYEVANSCMFNVGDDAKLTRTAPNSSATHDDKFTFSCWIKRAVLGARQQIYSTFDGGGAPYQEFQFYFKDDDTLRIQTYNSSNQMELIPNRLFRDVSSWYHFVFAYDSSQGTASNRAKLYVNGTQETSFATETYPSQNVDGEFAIQNHIQAIGNNTANNRDSGLYLAEVVGVDGQALAQTQFGEFDEDSPTIWKPKDVSGINVGTLGFYLDFEDSSALGNDVSGVGDFTATNLAATDQATDTCTNNFCTMNPLYAATSSAFTFAQGNCELTQNDTNWRTSAGTMGVSSGKWYFEAKGGQGTNGYTHYGWASTSWLNEKGDGSMNEPSTNHNGPCVTYYGANGNNYYSTSSATGSNGSYGATWDNDHTIGCFLDLDNNKAYWSKDGTLQNSGTGYSIESGFTWLPIVGGYDMDNGGESVKVNFGGCPATTISSGNTDGEYGNFEYTTTITGDGSSKTFKALCTKNLAEYGG